MLPANLKTVDLQFLGRISRIARYYLGPYVDTPGDKHERGSGKGIGEVLCNLRKRQFATRYRNMLPIEDASVCSRLAQLVERVTSSTVNGHTVSHGCVTIYRKYMTRSVVRVG